MYAVNDTLYYAGKNETVTEEDAKKVATADGSHWRIIAFQDMGDVLLDNLQMPFRRSIYNGARSYRCTSKALCTRRRSQFNGTE